MTVSTTQYYVNITGTGTLNEEFAFSFKHGGANEIYVWVADANGVLERRFVGTDFIVFDNKIRWQGVSPTTSVRIQRHLTQNQLNRYREATPTAYEKILDDVAARTQQGLINDPLQKNQWSANDDKISNVRDGVLDDDLVTKKQVDDDVGGGTDDGTVWNIGAGDVGKYATSNGSGFDWQSFTNMPDPKGQEGKTLDGTPSWADIDNVPLASSGTANDVLKDVDAKPTWTTVREYPNDGTADQILSVEDDGGGGRQQVWRNYRGVPKYLPANAMSVLTQKDAANTDALRNEFVEHFGVTNIEVTGTLGDHTGTDVVDHQVYKATFTNHLGVVPDFIHISAGTYIPDDANGDTLGHASSFIINIVSMTATTITIAAASLLHETAANDDPTYTHETSVQIPLNILWVKR